MADPEDAISLDAIKLALSTALRVALLETGVKQTELGEGIGWSQSAVGSWMTCQNAMTIEAVLAIDRFLALRPGLLQRSGLVTTSIMDAIATDGALDDQAKDDLRARYRQGIGETARRRIRDASSGDDDDTLPTEALFGPGWPHEIEAR